MDLKEAYRTMQEASGIEEGDTVKIIRIPEHGEMGWGLPFPDNVPNAIDGIFKVVDVDKTGTKGIRIKYEEDYYFWVPFFVCEIVEKAKKDEVSEMLEDLDFGCKHENVEKLVRAILNFKADLDNRTFGTSGSFYFDTTVFGEYQNDIDKLLQRLLSYICKESV